jgi:hypothetical protein
LAQGYNIHGSKWDLIAQIPELNTTRMYKSISGNVFTLHAHMEAHAACKKGQLSISKGSETPKTTKEKVHSRIHWPFQKDDPKLPSASPMAEFGPDMDTQICVSPVPVQHEMDMEYNTLTLEQEEALDYITKELVLHPYFLKWAPSISVTRGCHLKDKNILQCASPLDIFGIRVSHTASASQR